MKRVMGIVCALLLVAGAIEPAFAANPGTSSPGFRAANEGPVKKTKGEKPAPKDSKEKSFGEMIKDRVVTEGLFTFYEDTTDNSVLMAIKPEQIGPIYLCNETRSQAEGAFFDNGTLTNSFPFYFQRVGKKIMMLEKNLRFRADTTSELRRAVASGTSDHLYGSMDIKSRPQDSTKAVLVDVGDLFVRDAQNLGYMLNDRLKTGISFDDKNSYFEELKSFPENSEVTVKLHYKTKKPIEAETMQNPYSFFHTYHYSLSTLPQTDYVPRIADDRVGHFLTMYEDYSTLDKNTPFVRYVERWNLKKKDPSAAVSEPVEPIVYWVENTVPPEYREAVKRGIEFWQPAFEKAGFKNAIIAKQMPDTASWDPADVRYSTVRWIMIPGGGYAVGPSRANPFTGQIYDADIRISADFIRYMFNNMEYFINPVSFTGMMEQPENKLELPNNQNERFCNYGAESALEAACGLTYLEGMMGDFANKDSMTQEYVNAYIVELVAHEIGHTLGFRHNFKASTIYSLDQINDRSWTTQHGTGGTVMDYTPANIAGKGKAQGEFYASHPGPYDDWVIEYAYKDFGAKNPGDEMPQLQAIASRAAEIGNSYGTDEDNFGNSPKSIDPLCNLFDQGSDPISYAQHRVDLTKDLWTNAISRFEKSGESYNEVYRAFSTGWRPYAEGVVYATKWIGGIHHNRFHVGDKAGSVPLTPVSAADQRRAMNFLKDNIFAANAFDVAASVHSKLQPERMPDFEWSVYDVAQVDYPFTQLVLNIQNSALGRLYSPYVTGRLVNNIPRYPAGAEMYTLFDMFGDVRKAIWGELTSGSNINLYRRQLQLVHLARLSNIYLSAPGEFPFDAVTLAANDLNTLKSQASSAVNSQSIDGMTRAHLREVIRQIDATTSAKKEYGQN